MDHPASVLPFCEQFHGPTPQSTVVLIEHKVKNPAYLDIPKGRRDVPYRTPGNIIPMQKDLRKLFDENAFGIDVDVSVLPDSL